MSQIGLKRARPLLAAIAMLLAACASSAVRSRQAYRHGRVAYRVGALPADWQPIPFKGEDLAFRHREGGTIAASAHCPTGDDVSLAVLTNHLLFGIDTKKEQGSSLFLLDGRQALRTQLLGELDGVPVELELVVLKKDGCIYDLQIIAAPQVFSLRQRDFETFVQGFATEGGR